jgi:hypothetical protein
VRVNEELPEWKSSGSGSRKSISTALGIRRVDHVVNNKLSTRALPKNHMLTVFEGVKIRLHISFISVSGEIHASSRFTNPDVSQIFIQ